MYIPSWRLPWSRSCRKKQVVLTEQRLNLTKQHTQLLSGRAQYGQGKHYKLCVQAVYLGNGESRTLYSNANSMHIMVYTCVWGQSWVCLIRPVHTHMPQYAGMHALHMYDCIVGIYMYVYTYGWVYMHVCVYMHARTLLPFFFMCGCT